jgi:hypothetical protein
MLKDKLEPKREMTSLGLAGEGEPFNRAGKPVSLAKPRGTYPPLAKADLLLVGVISGRRTYI